MIVTEKPKPKATLASVERHLRGGELQPRPLLTDRQQQTLQFIWEFFSGHEYYPTNKEILEGIGAGGTNAGAWVDGLVKKGILSKHPKMSRRRIRITTTGLEELQRMGLVEATMQLELTGEPEQE